MTVLQVPGTVPRAIRPTKSTDLASPIDPLATTMLMSANY